MLTGHQCSFGIAQVVETGYLVFREFRLNGTTDGAQPYFYFTINPKLDRLSLPLTLWQESPVDRVHALDLDKQNCYPLL